MRYMGRAARMERHHKRHKGEAGINLVSMIDMLTVLVFFLLVYSTEAGRGAAEPKDVQAAGVDSPRRSPHEAVVVIITERDILLERQVGRKDRRRSSRARADHSRA